MSRASLNVPPERGEAQGRMALRPWSEFRWKTTGERSWKLLHGHHDFQLVLGNTAKPVSGRITTEANTVNQTPQILKKQKQHRELLPQNWAKDRAAMLPGAFVWVAFFQTARAGEARSGPGLLAIAGALPPPCGTSFKTPCATQASFPGGLAVGEDLCFKERVPSGLGCPLGLLAFSQGPEGDLGSGALSAKNPESQGPEGTSSGQELVSEEVVGRGLHRSCVDWSGGTH